MGRMVLAFTLFISLIVLNVNGDGLQPKPFGPGGENKALETISHLLELIETREQGQNTQIRDLFGGDFKFSDKFNQVASELVHDVDEKYARLIAGLNNVKVDTTAVKSVLNITNKNIDLKERNKAVTPQGTYKAAVTPEYKGIPIYGGLATVETDENGNPIEGTSISFIRNLPNVDEQVPDVTPDLTKEEALNALKRSKGHCQPEVDVLCNHTSKIHVRIENEQGFLTVDQTSPGVVKLIYIVNYYAEGPLYQRESEETTARSGEHKSMTPARRTLAEILIEMFKRKTEKRNQGKKRKDLLWTSRPYAKIDAKTGEILASWEGLSAATPASVSAIFGNPTHYGGAGQIETIDITKSGSTCQYELMYDSDTRIQVKKYADISKTTGTSFLCSNSDDPSYDKTNDAFSPMNSAMYWAERSMDMRNSPKVKSMSQYSAIGCYNPPSGFCELTVIVHAPIHAQAEWTGTKVQLGDGNSGSYPYVEPDILGHEIGHMLIEHITYGLEKTGQQGAIMEAYADMTGVATVYFKTRSCPNRSCMKIGNTVHKGTTQPLRDLCNPGLSLVPGIDHKSKWQSGMETHKGSGIFSKAFCLLSDTAGWDVLKAYGVFSKASEYWSSTSTFVHAACQVRESAGTLDPSLEMDIRSAFDAVGISVNGVVCTLVAPE